jgi:hypothetical protein
MGGGHASILVIGRDLLKLAASEPFLTTAR